MATFNFTDSFTNPASRQNRRRTPITTGGTPTGFLDRSNTMGSLPTFTGTAGYRPPQQRQTTTIGSPTAGKGGSTAPGTGTNQGSPAYGTTIPIGNPLPPRDGGGTSGDPGGGGPVSPYGGGPGTRRGGDSGGGGGYGGGGRGVYPGRDVVTGVTYDTGTNWVPQGSNAPLTGGEYGFWGPVSRPIAGPSGLQNWASSQIGNLYTSPEALGEGMDVLRNALAHSGDVATGRTLATDEAMRNAKTAFETNIAPDILQAHAAMGLSRSTAPEYALSSGWANMATPLMQQALSREQGAINASTQTGLNVGQMLPGLAFQNLGRQQNVLNQAMQFGNIGRDIAQQANNSLYEDFLRRQALWENLRNVPMGQATSTFGGSTHQRSGGLAGMLGK